MFDNTLTLNEKNRIWPIITKHFGIDPIQCGVQGRSDVEAVLGEIAKIINPNRPGAGDRDLICRLQDKVDAYKTLVSELTATIEDMQNSIDSINWD